MGPAVVRMPIVRGGPQDELRSQPAQDGNERVLLGLTRAQAAVAAVEEVQGDGPERGRGVLGLPPPLLRRAAGAGFSPRQVQNAHAPPGLGEYREGTAAAELDIVWVGADGQHVESVGRQHQRVTSWRVLGSRVNCSKSAFWKRSP